jgi:hypothetical protein
MNMHTVAPEELEQVTALLRDQAVWGVISTFAFDSFYDGLTFMEAKQLAEREVAREPGRDAVVVIAVQHFEGRLL